MGTPKLIHCEWCGIDVYGSPCQSAQETEGCINHDWKAAEERHHAERKLYEGKTNDRDYEVKGEAKNDPTNPQHYLRFEITPTEYIQKNKLGWCEGNVVKYVSRHDAKNGLEDLRKARKCLELLAQLEYGEEL